MVSPLLLAVLAPVVGYTNQIKSPPNVRNESHVLSMYYGPVDGTAGCEERCVTNFEGFLRNWSRQVGLQK